MIMINLCIEQMLFYTSATAFMDSKFDFLASVFLGITSHVTTPDLRRLVVI